jgi:rhodanese-related sulfurtransferase
MGGPKPLRYNRVVTVALQITPKEVKQRLDAGEKLRLIDVREPFEYAQARIEGSELIPMRTVPSSLDSLQREEAPFVVLCHHGMRSLQVVSWLREQGVERCSSMEGGIDRWSLEVDPAVPRYV